jgi:hypothetical protein
LLAQPQYAVEYGPTTIDDEDFPARR